MSKRSFASLVLALLAGLMIVPVAMAADGEPENDGRYMVKFKDFRGASQAVRAAGGNPVIELEPQGVVAAYLPEQALRGLQNNPNVEYIEVDPRRYLMSQVSPYGIAMVQANDAVFASTNSSGCTVCIIDSGYYRNHEDLQSTGVTGTNDSGTGFWYEDSCGHGTHVAGTVAARNNTVGVIGVNSNGSINLHIEKVFNGSDCKWAYSSSLVQALNRCQNAVSGTGRKLVVSMSLGGSTSSSTENNAFANAYNAGVLSVAAAGNDGSTRLSYPASYASVISVAAVDSTGTVASFSQRNSAVELAAPGPVDLRGELRVAELALPFDPGRELEELRHHHLPVDDVAPATAEIEREEDRLEAVDPARLGVEVHELPDLAGVLRGGLQVVVVDERRAEALLVLDLHAVEDAAVGVDPDVEVVGGCESVERRRG